MFQLAEVLGMQLGDVERMPATEFMEWSAYFAFKAKGSKADMSPDQMLAQAKQITRQARGRHGRR